MAVLLVANDGGHVMQLHTLRQRLMLADDVVWVTPRTPQTESLLEGENVFWVAPCPSRDVGALVRNTAATRKLFSLYDVTLVVSTGAALALAVLPQASLRGIEAIYIESATRISEPSLSGSVLAKMPGVRTFSQSMSLTRGSWDYLASPWDVYEMRAVEPVREVSKAVVTLGTSPYGFRRALERLVELMPPEAEVLWQTGVTDASGLGIDARERVRAAELHEAMREADVVIAHAGTGSALASLEAGRCPIMMPRRASHGEHVDDHQLQIALDFALRDLALVRDAEHLKRADLYTASARRVMRRKDVDKLQISRRAVNAPREVPVATTGRVISRS